MIIGFLRRKPHSSISKLIAVDVQPKGKRWPDLDAQLEDLVVHVFACEDLERDIDRRDRQATSNR